MKTARVVNAISGSVLTSMLKQNRVQFLCYNRMNSFADYLGAHLSWFKISACHLFFILHKVCVVLNYESLNLKVLP